MYIYTYIERENNLSCWDCELVWNCCEMEHWETFKWIHQRCVCTNMDLASWHSEEACHLIWAWVWRVHTVRVDLRVSVRLLHLPIGAVVCVSACVFSSVYSFWSASESGNGSLRCANADRQTNTLLDLSVSALECWWLSSNPPLSSHHSPLFLSIAFPPSSFSLPFPSMTAIIAIITFIIFTITAFNLGAGGDTNVLPADTMPFGLDDDQKPCRSGLCIPKALAEKK